MNACINLRTRFGDRFKIRHEESYLAEKPEFRKEEEPWLQIVPCEYGYFYPHGSNWIGFASDKAGIIARRVAALPFTTVVQDGSDGANIIFDVCHFEEVAAIVRPKRRPPKRVLTPEQRQVLIDRTAAYRFLPQKKEAPGGLGRTQAPLGDSEAQGPSQRDLGLASGLVGQGA